PVAPRQADNGQVPLRPPIPASVDPKILESAAGDLAATGSITFLVDGLDGGAITYAVDDSTVRAEEGHDNGKTIVRLSRPAWDDMVGQVRTFINLFLSNELAFERGGFEQLADWDPVLKYLHAGIPPYHPARADFHGRDPAAVFTLDASDAELAAQLQTMGYLHVKSVFSPDEMRTADREIDRLAALAHPGDDQSWWVTAEDDTRELCRLVYATLRSPILAALENDPRVRRLGTLINPALRTAPDRMEGSAVLLKVPGNISGLSNIPWHQDCGMGGHAIICPAVNVGIQITGSQSATGNLQVIPGSHGQTVHYRWEDRLKHVPTVSIDTAPGDVTVHIGDLMHASPRPTGAGGRRTLYVTHYPPELWAHVGPGQAYNDLVRNRTEKVAGLQ
ncbi:MAG TPA: phytanoyl-CoA dioxygenase family protein, partial [Mycobacterium sp.]|nr:phytanoyl-CoA dioxygenase family protein [Mycobacterium sp.]